MTTSVALKENMPAGTTVVTARLQEEAMSLPVLLRIAETTGMSPTQRCGISPASPSGPAR